MLLTGRVLRHRGRLSRSWRCGGGHGITEGVDVLAVVRLAGWCPGCPWLAFLPRFFSLVAPCFRSLPSQSHPLGVFYDALSVTIINVSPLPLPMPLPIPLPLTLSLFASIASASASLPLPLSASASSLCVLAPESPPLRHPASFLPLPLLRVTPSASSSSSFCGGASSSHHRSPPHSPTSARRHPSAAHLPNVQPID